VTPVDAEPVAGAAARAGQAFGVEQGGEFVVTGALVQQRQDGEVHSRSSTGPGDQCLTAISPRPDYAFKGSALTSSHQPKHYHPARS
jgi:hypothetical protein